MVEIEFIYEDKNTIIQCNLEDKIEDILQKYITKINKDMNSLYFLYGGQSIDKLLSFNQLINKQDKEQKKVTILVNDNLDSTESESFCLSKYIICPKCKENSRLSIEKYRIKLYDCKNGHKYENILFKDFEQMQKIDESKIICNICKNTNKSNTYNHIFNKCISCGNLICPLCKSLHDKSHIIVNYEEKDFICNLHNELYSSFCNICKKDICLICESEHLNHDKISFVGIIPNKKELEDEFEKTKKTIYEFKKVIDNLNNQQFNEVKENIDIYFTIYSNIILNYEIKKRNYIFLQNIKDINKINNNIIDDLKKIINNDGDNNIINRIMEIYNQMTGKTESNNNIEKKNDSEKKENLNDDAKDNNKINENFKNFSINKIKKLESFKIKDESINNILILSDKRILITSDYIAIYNPKNNYDCDIFLKETYIQSIFQMEDDKIIYSNNDYYIKIIEIKENQINTIQVIEVYIDYLKLCKLSNGKILEYGYDPKIYFYSYKNGSLNKDNQIIEIKKNGIFRDICEINENEIAIYSIQKALNPFKDFNDYLIFYNFQNNKKKDKEIQSYKYSGGGSLYLLNENYIMVITNSKIILVDIKKKSFISDMKNSFDSILALNENIFLGLTIGYIYQLEIDYNKKKIIEKEKKEFSSEEKCLIKYNGNKLLFKSGKNELSIYGI